MIDEFLGSVTVIRELFQGDIICSEKRCESRDCSHQNDSALENSLICPKDQVLFLPYISSIIFPGAKHN